VQLYTLDGNLVIICWLYFKNCTFAILTDNIFSETPAPQLNPRSGGAVELPVDLSSLDDVPFPLTSEPLYKFFSLWLSF